MNTPVFPVRHACGRVLYADLQSEYPLFYTRQALIRGLTRERVNELSPAIQECPYCPYPLDMDWMRHLWLIDPMPYHLAVLCVARRVCSNCWGKLDIAVRSTPVWNEEYGIFEEGVMVLCPDCRYETIGYVSSRYAEVVRQADAENFETCAAGLTEALELEQETPEPPQPKASREEILARLGF